MEVTEEFWWKSLKRSEQEHLLRSLPDREHDTVLPALLGLPGMLHTNRLLSSSNFISRQFMSNVTLAQLTKVDVLLRGNRGV